MESMRLIVAPPARADRGAVENTRRRRGWSPSSPGAGEDTALLDPPAERGPAGSDGPPSGGDGDDGGRWDGGGWQSGDGDDPENEEPERIEVPFGANEIGFTLFLTAITTLFLMFVGAAILLRRTSDQGGLDPSPAVTPTVPPAGLALSTLVMLASSVTLTCATRAWRRGEPRSTRRWLCTTLVLGLTFLGAQAVLWLELDARARDVIMGSYGTVFYSLTGLHAVHVLGGLVYMGALRWRLRRGPLGRPAGERGPIELCAAYWHYMGVVWLGLFALLVGYVA